MEDYSKQNHFFKNQTQTKFNKSTTYSLKIQLDPKYTQLLFNHQQQLISTLRTYNSDLKHQIQDLKFKIQCLEKEVSKNNQFQQQYKKLISQNSEQYQKLEESWRQIRQRQLEMQQIYEQNKELKKQIQRLKMNQKNIGKENQKESIFYKCKKQMKDADETNSFLSKMQSLKKYSRQLQENLRNYGPESIRIPYLVNQIMKIINSIEYRNTSLTTNLIKESQIFKKFKMLLNQKEDYINQLKHKIFQDQKHSYLNLDLMMQQSYRVGEDEDVQSSTLSDNIDFEKIFKEMQKATDEVQKTEQQIRNISIQFNLNLL